MKPKTPAPRATRRTAAPQRLSREAWLDAAFEAVVEGGFDKLRVLTLAATLGVTRGSFYWHFEDHAAWLEALLQRWHQREIDAHAALRAAATDDAKADLLRLLDLALARGGADLKDMRFELALRGLGRRDAAVAQRLATVDAARLALFEAQFRRLCGQPRQAADLAALFYMAITGGIQAIARPTSSAQLARHVRGLIAEHLIEPHTAAHPAPQPAAHPNPHRHGAAHEPTT